MVPNRAKRLIFIKIDTRENLTDFLVNIEQVLARFVIPVKTLGWQRRPVHETY